MPPKPPKIFLIQYITLTIYFSDEDNSSIKALDKFFIFEIRPYENQSFFLAYYVRIEI